MRKTESSFYCEGFYFVKISNVSYTDFWSDHFRFIRNNVSSSENVMNQQNNNR
jgi:hypothetical protein